MTSAAVTATVMAYIAVLFVVSYISGRKSDNAGFFIGNHRTTWYMAAFAMISAAMSGVTFISLPGSVAADSFSYLQMTMGFTAGQMVIAFVLIPLFFRRKMVSLYQYLDERFDITVHRTGAWFFLVSKVLGASLKIYVVCAVMQLLVFDPNGLPFALNVLVTMCFVWLYTNRGGVRSLIWTDTLKTVCLVSSLVLSIVFIARGLGMSTAEVIDRIGTSEYSRVFFLDDPSSSRYFWKMFFSGLFVVVAMTGLDQDMMQLNLSCRTQRDAKINIFITAFFQIIIIVLFLALGVLLYTYATDKGLAIPEKSDQLFAQVAVNGGLPTVVGVVFVLGLIASTYSAAGSALTALTTSFTVDILNGPERYDEHRLTRVRRIVHVVMAVVMGVAIVAFDLFSDDSTINLIYKVVGYTYGPLLGMFAFGMLTHYRIRGRFMPYIAVASPLLSALLQYAAREYFDYAIGFELLVYNALITMAGMMLTVKRNED